MANNYLADLATVPEHLGEIPNPFSPSYPQLLFSSFSNVAAFCRYIYINNGPFRRAMEKLAAYFTTEIDVIANDPKDTDHQEKLRDILNNEMVLTVCVFNTIMTSVFYDNDITTVLFPFKRHLVCEGAVCKWSNNPVNRSYREMADKPVYSLKYDGSKFDAQCPNCKARTKWKIIDQKIEDTSRIVYKTYPLEEIDILYEEYSCQRRYIWKPPSSYKKAVKGGDLFTCEFAPKSVLDAVQNDDTLLLTDSYVHHIHGTPLPGIRHGGWGIPRIITLFEQLYQDRMGHKANTTMVNDYLVPLRVLMPDFGTSSGDGKGRDPSFMANLSTEFVPRCQSMIHRRRFYPESWHVSGIPMKYMLAGAEANQLIPVDLLKFVQDELFDAAGLPADLYRINLSAKLSPVMLKLMESQWTPLVKGLNRRVNWVARTVCEYMRWPILKAQLKSPTFSDDESTRLARMQVWLSDKISDRAGMETLGLDPETEDIRKIQEKKRKNKLMQEAQQEEDLANQAMQIAQQATPSLATMSQGDPNQSGGGGGAPGQAAPGQEMTMPSDPNAPITLAQLDSVAAQAAAKLNTMPETQRKSELLKYRRANPQLAAVIRDHMQSTRQQAQTAGGQQVMQQQFGQ